MALLKSEAAFLSTWTDGEILHTDKAVVEHRYCNNHSYSFPDIPGFSTLNRKFWCKFNIGAWVYNYQKFVREPVFKVCRMKRLGNFNNKVIKFLVRLRIHIHTHWCEILGLLIHKIGGNHSFLDSQLAHVELVVSVQYEKRQTLAELAQPALHSTEIHLCCLILP